MEQLPSFFPKDVRSHKVLVIKVLPEIHTDIKEAPFNKNQTITTLQCLGSGRRVRVHLAYSERRPKVKYTLKNLGVFADLHRNSTASPSCHLRPTSQFQNGFLLTAFLPGISHCKVYPAKRRSASSEMVPNTTTSTTPRRRENYKHRGFFQPFITRHRCVLKEEAEMEYCHQSSDCCCSAAWGSHHYSICHL